ncbi:MAG: hypothetical protein MI748_11025 [Opitutales bacterium]|nr:hypothetical protein [Opitutales bacterium]
MKRRDFLASGALLAGASTVPFSASAKEKKSRSKYADYSGVDAARAKPVLKREFFPDPVIIESVELLRKENNFICRVRSKDGAEGISIGHPFISKQGYPMFKFAIQRWFVGKDARDLDQILYHAAEQNEKKQGVPMNVQLATLEFAVLDMLGNIADKPLGALIGDICNPNIAIYLGTLYRQLRDLEPEVSLEMMAKQVEETHAKAVKLRCGSANNLGDDKDNAPGRTEKLIRMGREKFGDEMVLMMDANWSYSPKEAIRIGRLLEEYNYYFYEEPLPWNWYEEQKIVCDALDINMAGGEVEANMHQMRWLIANDVWDIIQPDIFYFGGMIRSMQVANMAAAKGKIVLPHMSSGGLGYLYMLQFVSACKNAGPFHEFKLFATKDANGTLIPIESKDDPIKSTDGVVNVPTGSGIGVHIDPGYISTHEMIYS